MDRIGCHGLDLLLLAPCQLKTALEELLAQQVDALSRQCHETLRYRVVSNAVAQEEVYAEIAAAQNLEQLPAMMVAPGIGHFFYGEFTRRFRRPECFAVAGQKPAAAFGSMGLPDPRGLYGMIGFNPLVFLVDRTRDPGLPVPQSWEELINGRYARKVAFRGRDGRSYCEGALLAVYTLAGEQGIQALSQTVQCRLHPAQMVKLAGSGRPEAPAVSVIPLGFARMARPSARVQIVWPREGAAVNPLMLLAKRDLSPGQRALADFLTGLQVARLFWQAGFYPMAGSAQELQERNYLWCGWAFLERQPVHALLDRLNGIMHAGAQQAVLAKGGCACGL